MCVVEMMGNLLFDKERICGEQNYVTWMRGTLLPFLFLNAICKQAIVKAHKADSVAMKMGLQDVERIKSTDKTVRQHTKGFV